MRTEFSGVGVIETIEKPFKWWWEGAKTIIESDPVERWKEGATGSATGEFFATPLTAAGKIKDFAFATTESATSIAKAAPGNVSLLIKAVPFIAIAAGLGFIAYLSFGKKKLLRKR